ncbi:MAG: ABC-ATPase domain-containing protein [Lewinellaceae bacterium]|nr:ABC-ATPase domain-containing protein [Lewinellaceae bacterium]
MQDKEELRRRLRRIDGRGYKSYKDIEGRYQFEDFELIIDHVQGDPFAAPSRLRACFPNTFPDWAYANRSREIALRDFLTRQFDRNISRLAKGNRGSGKSGTLQILRPGQEILERTAIVLYGDKVEVRFLAGLPAFGRRIAGMQAEELLLVEAPAIVRQSLAFGVLNETRLREHLLTNEDADALRQKLSGLGLIAFIADGALLPRASGVDPRPLKEGILFQSPPALKVEVELPNRKLSGMGIPEGITLVVGGGYHGKSTLLRAIELGVYNHIPGDGREFVVTLPNAAKARAEDGRYVEKTDISPFINNLPQGKDTKRFSTSNASGSTSQAANVIEALEAGAGALLIDEDTSATNFMIRDYRMQQLVPKEREPITPFIDKARQLYQDMGVSSIVVVGGSGLYFDIADRVICMIDYQPHDLTEEAKAISRRYREARLSEGGESFGPIAARHPVGQSMDARKGRMEKVKAHALRSIQFGYEEIDMSAVEQVVEDGQLRAIGDALLYARQYLDGQSLAEALEEVMVDIEANSLDVLSRQKSGHYSAFRKLELAAALNRLRGMQVK